MINQSKFERFKAVWEDEERALLMDFSWDPKSGNGDLITNECRRILKEKDQSWQAISNLETMFWWLSKGWRWGDEFDQYVTTTNHSRNDFTKDPFIYCCCVAVFLNRDDLITRYPPPTKPTGDKWRSASFFRKPELSWYKALIGEKNSYWFWRFFNYFIPVKHTYVMAGFMEQALKNSKQ